MSIFIKPIRQYTIINDNESQPPTYQLPTPPTPTVSPSPPSISLYERYENFMISNKICYYIFNTIGFILAAIILIIGLYFIIISICLILVLFNEIFEKTMVAIIGVELYKKNFPVCVDSTYIGQNCYTDTSIYCV